MTGKSWTYVGVLIALAGIATGVLQWQQTRISDLGNTVDNLREDKETLREKNKALESINEKVMGDRDSPALVTPENNATLLGKAVRLQWQPTQKRVMPVYILNYFMLGPSTYSTKLVIDPSENPEWTLFFGSQIENRNRSKSNSQVNPNGKYFWCVQEDAQEGASSCRSFSIYESAWDRLKTTGKLRVGATEGEGFHYLNPETQKPNGLEVDLIRWIVENLNKSLQRGADDLITVEYIYRPFEELLNELDEGKFDIALSQFTITEKREKEHPRMKFSLPYLRNKQILVRNATKAKKLSEQGTILGVIKSSSNKEAADHLEKRFGYPHQIQEYDSLGRLINDLLEGSVHFTLVDMVSPVARLAKSSDDLELYPAEEKIQQELENFYQQQAEQGTSRTFEEFGIAVSTRGDENVQLWKKIDELLCSKEGLGKITELVKKYEFHEFSIPPPSQEGSGCKKPLVIKSP